MEEDFSRQLQRNDDLPSTEHLHEPQSEPIPVISCVDCEYLLEPASSTDDQPHCGICWSESDDAARRSMMLKCMCPPEERFVCVNCATDPDSVCYRRVEN